jgi:hypothetical protein
MALKVETISDIQPFWHIQCPVCGGEEFVSRGIGGGVWCECCNARFFVRDTAGDAGCVVDCFFDDICNFITAKNERFAYRAALRQLGYFTDATPVAFCYKILKEPDGHTWCTDAREWILAARPLPGTRPLMEKRDGKEMPLWRHLKEPLVSKETALKVGAEREE